MKADIILIISVVLFVLGVLFLSGCAPKVPEFVYQPSPTPEIVTVIKNISPIQAALLIGIVGSIFASFMGGAKYGVPLLISCLIGYGLTSAMLFYAKLIALISLVGGTVLCGYYIFIKQRALKEIVIGVQKLKDYSLSTPRNTTNGLLSQEQSKATRKIVSKIKKEI